MTRVRLDRDGAVAVVTLDRPEAANALDAATFAELSAIERELAADESVRVVVLTGAGRHFCAGVDLTEAMQRSPWQPGVRLGFDLVPQPIIAAINGSAMGGGCELALACDLRVMSSTATIGLPEAVFGELPRGGGTARLARLVGPSRAKLMIMSGEPVDAETALRIGLVDVVAEPRAVLDEAMALARRLADQPGYVLRTAKYLVDRSLEQDLPSALELERRMLDTMATDDDKRAARAAARERNPLYARLLPPEP